MNANITFAPPYWSEYVKSHIYPNESFQLSTKFFFDLLITPTILGIFGIALVITYHVFLYFRYGFTTCFSPHPNRQNEYQNYQNDREKFMKYQKYFLLVGAIIIPACIVVTFSVVIPYYQLNTGFKNTSASLVRFEVIFSALLGNVSSATDDAYAILNTTLVGSCELPFLLQGIINAYVNTTIGMIDTFANIRNDMKPIKGYLNTGITTINKVETLIPVYIWFFAVIIIILLSLWVLLAVFYRNRKFLNIMVNTTEILTILLMVFYIIELFGAKTLATVCYPSPTYNIIKLFQEQSFLFNYLKYYTSCRGRLIYANK